MVQRPVALATDDSTEALPSAPLRFVLATGSLVSLFAIASVWIGGLLGG